MVDSERAPTDDGLVELIPLFRRLVDADLLLANAVWLYKASPHTRRALEGRRESARLDVAANLVARGWTPP